MEVINKINVYEVDGNDKDIEYGTTIEIKSHWNFRDRVCLNIFGKEITVNAEDLKRAIDNAVNVSR